MKAKGSLSSIAFDHSARSKIKTFAGLIAHDDESQAYDELLPSSSEELPTLKVGCESCLSKWSGNMHRAEPYCCLGPAHKEDSTPRPPQLQFLPMFPHTTLLELYMEMEVGYAQQGPLKDIRCKSISDDERKDFQLRSAIFFQVKYKLEELKREGKFVNLETDLIIIDKNIRNRGLIWRDMGERCLIHPSSVWGKLKANHWEKKKAAKNHSVELATRRARNLAG
jgi:hypothetical protein